MTEEQKSITVCIGATLLVFVLGVGSLWLSENTGLKFTGSALGVLFSGLFWLAILGFLVLGGLYLMSKLLGG